MFMHYFYFLKRLPVRWLTPIIPGAVEVEIRRTKVQGQPSYARSIKGGSWSRLARA
jgi:hypothetical protein